MKLSDLKPGAYRITKTTSAPNADRRVTSYELIENDDGLRVCAACSGLCEELVDLHTGKVLAPGKQLHGISPTPRRLAGATKLTVQAGARGAVDTRYFCPRCSPTMQAMIDSLIEAIRIANTEAT